MIPMKHVPIQSLHRYAARVACVLLLFSLLLPEPGFSARLGSPTVDFVALVSPDARSAASESVQPDSISPQPSANAGWEELNRYVELAIQQNPELQSLRYRYSAGQERIREVGVLPDPEVTLSYDFNPMMANSYLGRFSISAMQMIPWFGTLQTRRSLQRSESAAHRSQIEARALDIIEEIQLLWLSIAEIRQEILAYQASLERLKELENIVLTRYEAGRSSQADLLRLQMEEERFRSGIAEREDRVEPLRAALNERLNRPAGSEIITPGQFTRKPQPYGREELLIRIDQQNPLYNELDARHAMAVGRQRMAELDGRPGIGLGIEVMGRDFGPMSMFPDARESVIGMAAIRVPLFRSRYHSQRHQAELEIRSLELERIQTNHSLSTALEEALEQLRRSERTLRLLEQELIPRAEQAASILMEEYGGGQMAFDEVIRIERDLLQLQLERTTSLIGQNRAVIRIERLVSDQPYTLFQEEP
jgi:outer membrane protein, heavy metal efflux system